MPILNSAYERKHVLGRANIAAETLDGRMSSFELLERGLVAATGNHPSTTCRKSFGKCATYAGAAAGHHNDTIAPVVCPGVQCDASCMYGSICLDLSTGSHGTIESDVNYRAARQNREDGAGFRSSPS